MAEGMTAREISEAVHAGNDEFVAAALRDHRGAFEARGWNAWLHTAAGAGRVRLVQLFLQAGAAVNPPAGSSDEWVERAIDAAALEGHLEVVRWLLDNGAEVNHEIEGAPVCRALADAAAGGFLDVVRLLVERGDAVNGLWGRISPLDHAAMYGHTDVVEYLRSVGGTGTVEFARPEPAAPPRLKEGQPAVAGAALGKWRTLFEGNLPPAAERGSGVEYEFGPPATADELAAAEKALGVRLPADVREMLTEFNGVWYTTAAGRALGHPAGIAFLDVEHLSARVPAYLADTDNPLPPKKALRKVVWVAQSNGFGDLWGVCAEPVGPHRAGAVVRLDHEAGELEPCQPDLAAFVRAGRFPGDK